MTRGNITFTLIVIATFSLIYLYLIQPLKSPPTQTKTSQEQEPKKTITKEKAERISQYVDKLYQNEEPQQTQHQQEQSTTKAIVPFYNKPYSENLKFISVKINNIETEMMLDTGASYIAINNDTMQTIPNASPMIPTIMTTAGTPVKAYLFKAHSIKIGNMELFNVQCAYIPQTENNLLGGSFLANFHYYINEIDKTLTLIPNNERVKIKDNNIETISGTGYAEIEGKKYIYNNGNFEKQ